MHTPWQQPPHLKHTCNTSLQGRPTSTACRSHHHINSSCHKQTLTCSSESAGRCHIDTPYVCCACYLCVAAPNDAAQLLRSYACCVHASPTKRPNITMPSMRADPHCLSFAPNQQHDACCCCCCCTTTHHSSPYLSNRLLPAAAQCLK